MKSDLIVRKAERKDLNEIFHIFLNVIENMRTQNIEQWDEHYPNLEILEIDIKNEQMYLLEYHQQIAAIFVLNQEADEAYMNGYWNYPDTSYVVVHRFCVNPVFQNQGFGRKAMCLLEEILKLEGVECIRLDAFSENPFALKLYDNLGYKKVGEACFRKGLFFLYEKNIAQ